MIFGIYKKSRGIMSDSTKLSIQTNMNKLINKTARCDATVVNDIALLSSVLAIANYTNSLKDEDQRDFAKKLSEYIELFPKKCTCKE